MRRLFIEPLGNPDRPFVLRLSSHFTRGQVPKRAVMPVPIVLHLPGPDRGGGDCHRAERMDVEAFVPEAAVERLDVRVLHGRRIKSSCTPRW